MSTSARKLSAGEKPAYVESVIDGTITLVCRSGATRRKLTDAGIPLSGARLGRRYRIPAGPPEQTACLFGMLRDAGVAFSAGKEWSPEELFCHYRDDKGLIGGRFLCLFWRGPDDVWLEER